MNQKCKVCGEPAAGFHFGAFTCEGCKVSKHLYNLNISALASMINFPTWHGNKNFLKRNKEKKVMTFTGASQSNQVFHTTNKFLATY